MSFELSASNSKKPVTAAPIAARPNKRFSLDVLRRSQINKYIAPIVKQAVAAADHKIVIVLKTLKNLSYLIIMIAKYNNERNKILFGEGL